MMEVGRAHQWQGFWDRDEYANWDLFFAEQNRWFHEHSDATERAERMRQLIADSLDDTIDLDQRVRAVLTLKELPGGAKAMTPDQIKKLLTAVASEPALSEFVVETADFLVPAAGKEAALEMVDVLSSRVGPDAQALMLRICSSLPAAERVVLSEDKRWQVRVAATRSLEDIDAELSNEPLRARLTDESILVRVAAVEALARRRDKKSVPALAALSQDPQAGVRAAAAYAYGLLGGESGLRGLEPLLFDDAEAEVRRRAIEGLREGKTTGSAELLLRVFEDERERTVRAAAAAAIVELETPELVDSLVQRLDISDAGSNARVALVNVLARFSDKRTGPLLRRVMRGDDNLSKDAASLGLARRWDPVAVTQLIRMVQARRTPRAAVVHLEILSSQGFESTDYDEIARNYADWYKIKSTGRPSVWFRDALMERSHRVAVLNSFVALPDEGRPPLIPDVSNEAIPLLLRALRDREWYIARNASLVLAHHIGKDAPPVLEYFISPDEHDEAIKRFNVWWEKEEKRIEKERRG